MEGRNSPLHYLQNKYLQENKIVNKYVTDYDGEYVVLNSARDRVKDRVMRRSGLVAMAISDPENPYRYIQIRGSVVEITEEGAREMIDHLSMKYTGGPYDGYKGEIRVTYKLVPKFVSSMG